MPTVVHTWHKSIYGSFCEAGRIHGIQQFPCFTASVSLSKVLCALGQAEWTIRSNYILYFVAIRDWNRRSLQILSFLGF